MVYYEIVQLINPDHVKLLLDILLKNQPSGSKCIPLFIEQRPASKQREIKLVQTHAPGIVSKRTYE